MNPRATFVSVVIPLANDQPRIRSAVEAVAGVLNAHYRDHEIILVDDSSTDGTLEEVEPLLSEYPGVRLLRLSRQHGTDIAIAAGLNSAIGECVVVLVPGCDPPEQIPALVDLVERGHGVVIGVARPNAADGWLEKRLRGLFSWYCRRLLRLHVPALATRLQAFHRKAVTAITRIKAKSLQFPAVATTIGYDAITFEYDRLSPGRELKKPVLYYLERATAITVSSSIHPLRLVSYLGGVAGLLNLLWVGYVVAVNLVKARVAEGWTTLSLQMSAMFFFVFVILIVICEYLGRTLEETKERPLYHVLEERNASVIRFLEDRRNVV